jgi:hypothetical protein
MMEAVLVVGAMACAEEDVQVHTVTPEAGLKVDLSQEFAIDVPGLKGVELRFPPGAVRNRTFITVEAVLDGASVGTKDHLAPRILLEPKDVELRLPMTVVLHTEADVSFRVCAIDPDGDPCEMDVLDGAQHAGREVQLDEMADLQLVGG